jgi:hypothetical protein
MIDIFLGLAFVAIVISPAVVDFIQEAKSNEDSLASHSDAYGTAPHAAHPAPDSAMAMPAKALL